MPQSRKKIEWVVAAVGMVAIAGIAAVLVLLAIRVGWTLEFRGAASGQPLRNEANRAIHLGDINRPDAIIDSASLSSLPQDLIRVPLLKSLLTQDFVDYYESRPARLSLEGAFRRMAFEHDQDWHDDVIRQIFDEPAHVLLWRTPDHRLGHWLISMRRNGVARLAQAFGVIAASDSQLERVAALPDDTPVYALRLGVGQTLLFVAKGDRLVMLSEPGMLLDSVNGVSEPMRDRADAVARMLDGNDDALSAYGLDDAPPVTTGHRLVVSVNYLSFGYQAFFSGINALRFDFAPSGKGGDSSWSSAALVVPEHLSAGWDSAELWHALPVDPAACVSLPVNWEDATRLLDAFGDTGRQAAPVLRSGLTGAAAVCWYAKSSIVSPVFIARLGTQDAGQREALKNTLGNLFEQVIGAYENRADAAGYSRLPVQTRHDKATDLTVWMRPVSARAGTAARAAAPFADQLSVAHYFPVTLALTPRYAIFSPDARLVDDALAVLDKRYPALADTIVPARQAGTVAVIAPASASAMVEREAGLALPADQEAVFRNAAREHLFPRLRAAAQYPAMSLSLPEGALPAHTGWVNVEWHSGN